MSLTIYRIRKEQPPDTPVGPYNGALAPDGGHHVASAEFMRRIGTVLRVKDDGFRPNRCRSVGSS